MTVWKIDHPTFLVRGYVATWRQKEYLKHEHKKATFTTVNMPLTVLTWENIRRTGYIKHTKTPFLPANWIMV